MLCTVTPVSETEHLLNACAVCDSVAVPFGLGFFVTLAVKLADLQVRLNRSVENTALVPLARLDFSTAPVLTAVPPALPIVSTFLPVITGWQSAAGKDVTVKL